MMFLIIVIIIVLLTLYFIFKDRLKSAGKDSMSQVNEQDNSIKENTKDLFDKDKANKILSNASEDNNEMLTAVKPSEHKLFNFANELNIPNNVMELLWIKGGPLNNYTGDEIKEQYTNGIRFYTLFQTEPSLIDISLPIDERINELDSMEDIGYYPSYKGLSPKQRYIYLSWLQDISKPIAMGYVFIFYYGLERHLMFGKYREAVTMINYLQKFHNNSSFYSYSTDAMLIGILKHNDLDMLNSINYKNASNSVYALVKATLNKQYSAEDIIRFHKIFGFTNNRYIKSQYSDFLNKLNETLREKYEYEYYPLPSNTISGCTGRQLLVVANYSLMYKDRFASAPDLSTNKMLCDEIFSLLSEVHEKIKSDNRNKRKKNSNDTTAITVTTSVNNETQSTHYISNERKDKKPTTNENITNWIKIESENSNTKKTQSTNPKFHRTAQEDELSFNFWTKYEKEFKKLEDSFCNLYGKSFKSDNLDIKISTLQEALEAWNKAKSFCYSKGEGGKIYFQDMWEYSHNSKNDCFSYGDNIKESLEDAVYEKNVLRPTIKDVISKNEGILQKNIYSLIPDIEKSKIQSILRVLENNDEIIRIKKSNSYELHIKVNKI